MARGGPLPGWLGARPKGRERACEHPAHEQLDMCMNGPAICGAWQCGRCDLAVKCTCDAVTHTPSATQQQRNSAIAVKQHEWCVRSETQKPATRLRRTRVPRIDLRHAARGQQQCHVRKSVA
eukprot:6775587-Prymnesium_polylepis.2